MTFRIAQISDTHLSDEKPFFVANFECIAHSVNALHPDLVINTGDVSLDGAGRKADLDAARRRHSIFDAPVRFIPGNHDTGDSAEIPNSKELPIDPGRREAYRAVFGEDWWRMDVLGWRLIAVNAQLLGSGLATDDEQLDFIEGAAMGAGSRRIALFIHKPLFDQNASENVVGGRFLPPASRGRLLQAFGERRPAVVASGHVHQYRATLTDNMRCVWAPSTGFFIPDSRQPRYGLKNVGFVVHEFREDGRHSSYFETAAGVVDLNIADFPDAYGPLH